VVNFYEALMFIGFWQYGLIDWEQLYECLGTVISAEGDWAVFEYNENTPMQKGVLHLPNRNLYPDPGTYIILRPGIYRSSPILMFSSHPLLSRWFSYRRSFGTRLSSDPPPDGFPHCFSCALREPTKRI
jgi:hypothetical protein